MEQLRLHPQQRLFWPWRLSWPLWRFWSWPPSSFSPSAWLSHRRHHLTPDQLRLILRPSCVLSSCGPSLAWRRYRHHRPRQWLRWRLQQLLRGCRRPLLLCHQLFSCGRAVAWAGLHHLRLQQMPHCCWQHQRHFQMHFRRCFHVVFVVLIITPPLSAAAFAAPSAPLWPVLTVFIITAFGACLLL